jgi:hypothetical protein
MKIPFQLVAALPTETRHAQMAVALKHNIPALEQLPIDDEKSISIVCYGPSLKDTWKTIKRPIITVSGALHFLANRGIVPDYHIDCDPRPHKVKHISPPVDGVHYIMGSCCNPETWNVLKRQKVSLVHFYMSEDTHDWIAHNDPGGLMIHPGSTVGLCALHVGGMLGYRHFEIHGMDGSIRDGKRHAGTHYGHKQGGYTWDAGRVTYQTSKIMSNACAEVINTFRMFPIFGVFHGSGLQQALIDEEYDMDNVALAGTPKADLVRNYKAVIMQKVA